ncbi:uncharacterized protein [Phyllobates terribilis]|uniref:uncharacterized protein n=1 Tax=Phyllobates terribilis TaxID=111132 RepID=UPI003CCAF9D8
MEQVTYSKLNLKKSHGHPPKKCSAEEDVPSVVYADIRTALSQSHLASEEPVPEVQKKTLKKYDCKTLIIVLLIVLLCCAAGYIVYTYRKDENKLNINQPIQELSANKTEHSSVYTYRKDENKLNINQLIQELCINKTEHSSGCLLCPPDWRLHGEHCYYYSDGKERTWNQSRDDCTKMGTDLLVIKDQEQQESINKMPIAQCGDDTYWIGLHRDGDVWRWLDGEHYSSSLFEIKTQKSGDCVSKTRSDYYQDDCNTTKRWICVKKAVRISYNVHKTE